MKKTLPKKKKISEKLIVEKVSQFLKEMHEMGANGAVQFIYGDAILVKTSLPPVFAAYLMCTSASSVLNDMTKEHPALCDSDEHAD